MPSGVPLAIFLLPFFSFIVISFVIRPFLNSKPKLSGYITIASIGTALILSFWVLAEVSNAPGHVLSMPDYEWLVIGDTVIRLGVTGCDYAHCGHLGQPSGSGLLPGLHAWRPGLFPLLRLHVAFHRVHAGAGLGR